MLFDSPICTLKMHLGESNHQQKFHSLLQLGVYANTKGIRSWCSAVAIREDETMSCERCSRMWFNALV